MRLADLQPIEPIVWIAPDNEISTISSAIDEEQVITAQEQGAIQVYRLVKALLRFGYAIKPLSLTFVTTGTQAVHETDIVKPSHAAVHGLVGSLAKEYPHWKIRLLDLETDVPYPLSALFTTPSESGGECYARRGQEWFRQRLVPVEPNQPRHFALPTSRHLSDYWRSGWFG